MEFAGLRVAIGGASHGVGAACARLLAEKNARLLLCAREENELGKLAGELRKNGAEIFSIAADLGSDEGAAAFAKAAHEKLGGVDLGLICAGIAQRPKLLGEDNSQPRAAGEEPGDRARLLLQLQGNTIAPALAAIALGRAWSGLEARVADPAAAAKKAVVNLLERKATKVAPGRTIEKEDRPDDGMRQILVLSSLVTRRPAQVGLGPYLAAKSALEALVRTLAEELWPRVQINALCLGPVSTRLHLQAGTPREVRDQFPSPRQIAPLVLSAVEAFSQGLSGRCLDADAWASDPAAALWGDGRVAMLHPLHPPPSETHAPALEAEPGRAPSSRVRRALRESAPSLQRYPTDTNYLARRLAALHGVDPDSVVLSGGGATALLAMALSAVGASGDELISPFPTFEVVSALASRAGLRYRLVPARQNAEKLFEPHAANELLQTLGPRTRAVYVATPDNPTGVILPLEEERALRRGMGPRTALILDEAWTLSLPGERDAELGTADLSSAEPEKDTRAEPEKIRAKGRGRSRRSSGSTA